VSADHSGAPSTAAVRKAAVPAFDAREFRAALGMFATGVTIITARNAAGELVGLTANSFNSVSLAPPLVLWSLGRSATRGVDRWAGVEFTDGVAGAPLLAGAVATFECFNRSRYDEGDHVIFVGEVERCSHRTGAAPLLFHGGRFYTEHPL